MQETELFTYCTHKLLYCLECDEHSNNTVELESPMPCAKGNFHNVITFNKNGLIIQLCYSCGAIFEKVNND